MTRCLDSKEFGDKKGNNGGDSMVVIFHMVLKTLLQEPHLNKLLLQSQKIVKEFKYVEMSFFVRAKFFG
jgi:hypothetical protein